MFAQIEVILKNSSRELLGQTLKKEGERVFLDIIGSIYAVILQ